MRSAVVIPTYNEAVALPTLLDRLLQWAPTFHILIVDDNSPDGTGRIADDYAAASDTVSVLHRPGKMGLGSAYRHGFQHALDAGYEAIFEMDADHSHNPRHLPALLDCLENDADVAIGSRYVNGVRVDNWPFRRLLLSRFANIYVNYASGLPASLVSDATSGYRGYHRKVLEAIGLEQVRSNGYSFQIEMAYRAWRLGFRVKEVPITFEEHYLTSSKISRNIILEAIWRTPLLRFTAPKSRQPRPEAHRGSDTSSGT
jgi:glycosyltransferase involved in cell wall biosynthesis